MNSYNKLYILFIIILGVLKFIKSENIVIDYFNNTGLLISNNENCVKGVIENKNCVICSNFNTAGSYAKDLSEIDIQVINIYIIQNNAFDNIEISNKINFGQINSFCNIKMMVSDTKLQKSNKRITINGENEFHSFFQINQPIKYSYCQNSSLTIEGIDFTNWNNGTILSVSASDFKSKTYQIFNNTIVLQDLKFNNSTSILNSVREKWESISTIIINKCIFNNIKYEKGAPADPVKLNFKKTYITNCEVLNPIGSTFEIYGSYFKMDNCTIKNGVYNSISESLFGLYVDNEFEFIISNTKYINNSQILVFISYGVSSYNLDLLVDNVLFDNNTWISSFTTNDIFYIYRDTLQNSKVKTSFNNVIVKNNYIINNDEKDLIFLFLNYGGEINCNNLDVKDITDFVYTNNSNIIINNSNINVSHSITFLDSSYNNIIYNNSTFSKEFTTKKPFCNIVNNKNECKIKNSKSKYLIISILLPIFISTIIILIVIILIRRKLSQNKNNNKNINEEADVEIDYNNFINDPELNKSDVRSLQTNLSNKDVIKIADQN